jgi:hypothetical protein
MKIRVGTLLTKVVTAIVISCALLVCSTMRVGAQDVSSLAAKYAIDAKAARAMAAQLEHRKMIILYAVSDFEKSLYDANTTACEREVDRSAEFSLNGAQISTCRELMDERRAANDHGKKLKLHNQVVEITGSDPAARVSIDVMPGGQHDVFTLRQISERWLVRNFKRAPIQVNESAKSRIQ